MKRRRPDREPEPEEKRRPTLADRFITRKFAEWERAVHPKTLDQLKGSVRHARRFVLNEDATRRLGEIITTIPDLLVREHRFARAPYDLTWVEFPSHILWEHFRRHHPEAYEHPGIWGDPETADHTVGYLIDHERVNVICGGTVGDPDGDACVLPIQYRLHTEWTQAERDEFVRRAGITTDAEGRRYGVTDNDQIEMYLWGSTWVDIGTAVRLELTQRNTVEFLPSNPLHRNHRYWMGDGEMRDAVRGSVGELRNIIAILLVMNRPSLTKYVRDFSNSRGFFRGKLLPFMAHTTVTIDIDAVPTLRKIGTPSEDAVAKRRHEVKGHYKHDQIARDYSRIAGCIHEFQASHGPEDDWALWPDAPIGMPGEPGVPRNWVCAACGGKRWWQKDHERGSAEKGFVAHDGYDVIA